MSAPFETHDAAARAVLTPKLPCRASARARAWASVAMGAVIFVAGIVCGASALRPEPKVLKNWDDLLERLAKQLSRDLDLSEKQQEQIEQIVRAHQPRLNEIHARTIADMRTELQQVIEATSAVLTPEQNARFRAKAERDLDHHFPAADAPSPGEAASKSAPSGQSK
jgi:uncharacterized membrane-anchored protein YhcB (DUF1043 family)